MSRADFAYAQARLHARLESRFSENDWRMLAGSRNFGSCIDVVNQTTAANVTARLDRTNSVHAVERVLREEWSAIVSEISDWLPEKWQSAANWITVLPHLRRFEYSSESDGTPRWLRLETEFLNATGVIRAEYENGLATREVAKIWRNEWHLRLSNKRHRSEINIVLSPLLDRYLTHGTPRAIEVSKNWHNLADYLKGVFRKHSQTPIAIFAFLGLIALDFERLRGVLTDRIIFSEPSEPRGI